LPQKLDSVGSRLGRIGFADFHGRGDYEFLAAFAREHKFELVQISLDNPRYFPESVARPTRESIREKFTKSGVGLCIHGPSDIPLMNRHDGIRKAGIERFRELIEMAIDLGGEYFIIHPGRLAFYSLSTQKLFFMEQRFPEHTSELFHDSMLRLIDICSDKIQLLIENTHTVSLPFLKTVEKLCAAGLGLVWDVGHVELLSGSKRQLILNFFQEHLRYIRLAHLHDIKENAEHKTLGSGKLNIAGYLEVFRALSLDIILEVFPKEDLLKSLEFLNKFESEHDAAFKKAN
jgi:sugar phosphate isomerase/epimerase